VTNSGALQQKQTGHGEEGCNHTKVKYQPNLGMGGGGKITNKFKKKKTKKKKKRGRKKKTKTKRIRIYKSRGGGGGGGEGRNYITILKGEDQCWAPSVLSLSGNHLLRTSRGVIFPIIYHITSI